MGRACTQNRSAAIRATRPLLLCGAFAHLAFAGSGAIAAGSDFSSTQERFKVELSKQPCRNSIEKVLKDWKSQGDWLSQFSFEIGEKVFRSPTDTIGKWIRVKFLVKNEIELVQFTDRNSIQMKFSSACDATAAVVAEKAAEVQSPSKVRSGISVFRDSDLESMLKSKTRGVIFAWSPHDPASVEALAEVNQAAAAESLPLVALVDSSADPQAIAAAVRKLGLKNEQVKLFDSFDLSMRNLSAHFPSWMVFSKGRLVSSAHRGFETSKGYQELFASYF